MNRTTHKLNRTTQKSKQSKINRATRKLNRTTLIAMTGDDDAGDDGDEGDRRWRR